MNYKLYLDTAKRDTKVVKLLKDSEVFAEIAGVEDEFVLIKKILKDNNISINDISGIDVNKGPGSFTGLKVGVSIANAFNYAYGNIKSWRDLILPEYGGEPNISKPRSVPKR
ncbi:hypothetical protein KJ678_01715 [Patescibacteria group bacterium]|nr:hypothetical protein [Patescibacteria group bacterium]